MRDRHFVAQHRGGPLKMEQPRQLLEWADRILVFEEAQAEELKAMWPRAPKRPINLSISSHYGHGDEALKRLILERAARYLD